jgi:tetratricopeptide (TPR) repeat protein
VSFALVLLLQVAGASPWATPRSATLTAAAQASGRPPECAAHPRPPNRWDAARDPEVDRYCDLLARGFGELPFAPDTARERADAADRVSPGHAAPAVLRGRAYAGLKDYAHAVTELERARAIDSRSLDDPATLRDLARALSRSGRGADALVVYRALGPRLVLFPSLEERARTFLEGAELAFALGSSALDDAIAFLSEAKQLAVRDLQWRVASELALALDRRGRSNEAASLALDLARGLRKEPPPVTGDDASKSLAGEQQAALALVLESIDAQRASQAWERYLNLLGDESPWREHARKRLESLKTSKRAPAPPRAPTPAKKAGGA